MATQPLGSPFQALLLKLQRALTFIKDKPINSFQPSLPILRGYKNILWTAITFATKDKKQDGCAELEGEGLIAFFSLSTGAKNIIALRYSAAVSPS